MKGVFLSCIILFTFTKVALAGLEISEIMYDLKSGSDDGREWVEVYNNSEEVVDFSTYKFFEADTNHKITLVSGSAKLEPQGYALIVSDFAKFKNDWPGISANIFDSAFSLSNSSESLAIKNNEQVVDSYFYNSSVGGAGNGKSLQKINGAWTSTTPTPGSENKISYTPPPPQSKKEIIKSESIVEVEENSTLEDLPPIPIPTNSSESTRNSSNSSTYLIAFFVFLGVSTLGVYFLKKNRKITQNEEDFELLEE